MKLTSIAGRLLSQLTIELPKISIELQIPRIVLYADIQFVRMISEHHEHTFEADITESHRFGILTLQGV